MIRPSLDLAIAFNRSIREEDEWFDEPDEPERSSRALDTIEDIEDIEDVVIAAGVLASSVARTQGFSEGNKRTALLLASWLLDQRGGGLVLSP